MSRTNPVPLPAAVRVTLHVLCGTPEDLTGYKPGQQRWWLKTPGVNEPPMRPLTSDGEPGKGPDGRAGFTLAVPMIPGGAYLLGVGGQRLRIEAPVVDCTVVVDPRSWSYTLDRPGSAPAPVLSVVPDRTPTPTAAPVRSETPSQGTGKLPQETDPHRIEGVPSVAGVVYPTGQAAMEALGALIAGGFVTASDLSGNPAPVRVTRGRASPPPPPVPVVRDPVTDWTVHEGGPAWTPDQDDDSSEDDDVIELSTAPAWTAGQLPPVQPGQVASVQLSAPVAAPVPVPVAPDVRKGHNLTWRTAEETVSDDAVKRIDADKAHLRSFGIAPSPEARVMGGVVNSWGRANLSRSHQDWESQPRLLDNMAAMQAAVKAEQRIDVPAGRGCDISMRADGALVHPDWSIPLYPEETALRDLVSEHSSVLPRAGELMVQLSPDVRAAAWNDRVPHSTKVGASVLRTRITPSGQRAVFAAVSPGYTSLDADQLAAIVGEAVGKMQGGELCRGEALYNPDSVRVSIDGQWHVDHTVDFACGDVFKVGFRVDSHDGGSGAIHVSFGAWRNLCYNLIIVAHDKASLARVVHRGDRRAMVSQVRKAIEHVGAFTRPFVQRWSGLRQTPVSALFERPSEDVRTNLRAVFAQIARSKAEPLPDLPVLRKHALPEGVSIEGIERDVLVERLLSGWQHEPGSSLADVVNAVTRLHTERVPVPVLAQAEKVGGDLVMHWSNATMHHASA